MLSMLQHIIKNQSKSVLVKHAPILFSVLTKSFDLRRQLALKPASVSDAELMSLEEQRDSLTLDAVLRLNDSTFRPFFMRLVQWTDEGLPKKEATGRILRLTSLYGFLGKFFETLKVGLSRWREFFSFIANAS